MRLERVAAQVPADGITAISICGMGGETIRDILEAGKARLSGQERLILQPRARQSVPEGKVQQVARQARWITELLA